MNQFHGYEQLINCSRQQILIIGNEKTTYKKTFPFGSTSLYFLKDFPQENRQLREMSSRDVTKFYTSVLLQTRRNSTQPGNVTPLKVT